MGRITKRKPNHPGNMLKVEFLEPMGMAVDMAAEKIGVSSEQLSSFISEQESCTPDLANRLASALGTSVQFWLNLQNDLDTWHVGFNKKVESAKADNPDLTEAFIRDALLAKDEIDAGQVGNYPFDQ